MDLVARFTPPDDYEIPENDEARLRTVLNLPAEPGQDHPPEPIPPDVRTAYYAMKRCCDILGCGFPDWMIATVVVQAVTRAWLQTPPSAISQEPFCVPVPPAPSISLEPPTKFKKGEPVSAFYRGQWTPGLYRSRGADGRVNVEIEGKERTIGPEFVKPQEIEAPPEAPAPEAA
jgi:hypothetical protein